MPLDSHFRWIILGLVVLPFVAAGCHSGHVQEAQVTDDGRVLVFTHKDVWSSEESVPYVADATGVRPTRLKGRFALDPKGRWLLVFPDHEDTDLRLGDRLTLVRLGSRETWETHLPCDMAQDYIDAANKSLAFYFASAGSTQSKPGEYCIGIVFNDRSEVMFGPFPPDDQYWRWDAQAGWADEWRCLGEEDAKDHLAADSASRLIPVMQATSELPDCLVEMPSDGLSAFRTIWIRPDGSLLEIARKSDSPLWFASSAVVDIVACPATLLHFLTSPLTPRTTDGSSSADTIQNRLATLALAGMFLCGAAWTDVLVFPTEVRQARETLRRKIEERRKPAAATDEIPATGSP